MLTNSLCGTRETTGRSWESRSLNMRRMCGHHDCIASLVEGFLRYLRYWTRGRYAGYAGYGSGGELGCRRSAKGLQYEPMTRFEDRHRVGWVCALRMGCPPNSSKTRERDVMNRMTGVGYIVWTTLPSLLREGVPATMN